MSFCVESMLPFHSITASALMTSKLVVSQRSYGWLPEGIVSHSSTMQLSCVLLKVSVLFYFGILKGFVLVALLFFVKAFVCTTFVYLCIM